MNDNELILKTAAIINNILCKTDLDDNYITKLTLDDYAQCIHLYVSGALELHNIRDIAKEFGDDDPNVYAESEGVICIVFCNYAHEELITDKPLIEMVMQIK